MSRSFPPYLPLSKRSCPFVTVSKTHRHLDFCSSSDRLEKLPSWRREGASSALIERVQETAGTDTGAIHPIGPSEPMPGEYVIHR